MSGVDNRIVTMQFNNRQFEQDAATTMSTLQKLKSSMNFGSIVSGTVKGLGAVEGALSKIGLKTPFAPLIRGANAGLGIIGGTLDRLGLKNPFSSGVQGAAEMQKAAQQAAGPGGVGMLEGAVTGVSGKFIALTTVAVTALSNIVNRAVDAGLAFAKSFTIAPVLDGLHEYETNLKSIQTVQANTDRPLKEVEASLNELNKYSDQTIYNFSEMAKNVGTFTAAGVDLETSVSSIKGIANIAALSGSSSQQASTAMYQLSQAIASGKVGLQDWNSVVNAGMGGKKLQNALAQTAVAMGKIDAAQVKGVKSGEQLTIAGQSFRESIMAQPGQESWLSSDILVNTLSTMDGRFSKAALAAERTETGLRKFSDAQIEAKINQARLNLEQKNGVKYTDEQFAALQKMSTQAFKSATEVKTLGQVFDIAKETLASGYSATFTNIFGGLKEAKKLFTGMSNGLNQIINDNALARNTMLEAWSGTEIGGRETLIHGLKNAWEALLGILGPIKDGFRDIFPATTTTDLIVLTQTFDHLMKKMIPGKETMANLRDISSGFFSILGIGKIILFAIVDGLVAMFQAAGGGEGNFLNLAAGVGRALTSFHDFLAESGVVTAFFEGLGRLLAVPLGAIKGIAGGLAGIFEGFDGDKAGKVGESIRTATDELSGLSRIGQVVRDSFTAIGDFLGSLGDRIGENLVGIGQVVAGYLTGDSFDPALDAINTGLLAGITALLVKFFSGGISFDATGGLFDSITGTLESATGALTDVQNNLKADMLLKIGAAIGVLALSLLILSTINPSAMKAALAGMAAGFGLLIVAMAAMMKILGPVGVIQIYAVATALTKLALALLILSVALKVLSSISLGDMLRGLLGLSLMLKIISKAILPLAAGSAGMVKAAFSLILLGVAMNILAVALKIFATMSWEEMIKGLVGLTGVLLALTIGLKAMPELNTEAITLIALAVAMNILAIALKIFATMSWTEMAKGLIMLAASLGIISVALNSMKGLMLKAVGLIAVASAMVILSAALKVMGSMSWEGIAKGLVLLGGSLLIIAIGLQAIGVVGTIGAIGLLAAAQALAILAPVLVILGAMSWEMIVKGLVGLAGIFVILGVAGYLLAPVIPIIIGLGAAMLLLGAGLALAGAGALMAATAFGIVVSAGTAGAVVMAALLGSIIQAIPKALAAFGRGIVQFAQAIGQGAPKIARAFGNILSNILDQVQRNAPKLGKTFLTLLNTALNVIVKATPRIVNAGLNLIMKFLEAINKRAPKIVDIASDIIVKFINGVARNIGKIIQAGVNLVIKFVEGVARAIRNNSDRLGDAGADLGIAIVQGIASGISSAASRIADAARNAARSALQAAKDFLGIKSPSRRFKAEVGKQIPAGGAEGIDENAYMMADSAKNMGLNALDVLKATMSNIGDVVAMDPNMNPTVTPVLDLSELTKEANKMSAIFGTSPIVPTVSYAQAADISAATQDDDPTGGPGAGDGDTYVGLTQILQSPKPIDSVEAYRGGKTLIAQAKEVLK